MDTQALTQLEFGPDDFPPAEAIARSMGYEQTAYTSTSALWGLFCLNENPATWRGNRRALQAGCIIKTAELGFMFVQVAEDLGFPIGFEAEAIQTARRARLEELRTELRAERLSWDELHELQSLAEHIDPGDVELLEAAGVPEHD